MMSERVTLSATAALVVTAFIWSLATGSIMTDLWTSARLGGPGTRHSSDIAMMRNMITLTGGVYIPTRIEE